MVKTVSWNKDMRTLWTWKFLPGEGIPFMKMSLIYDCLIFMMGNLDMKDGLNIECRLYVLLAWFTILLRIFYCWSCRIIIWLTHSLTCVQNSDWLNLWNKNDLVFLYQRLFLLYCIFSCLSCNTYPFWLSVDLWSCHISLSAIWQNIYENVKYV